MKRIGAGEVKGLVRGEDKGGGEKGGQTLNTPVLVDLKLVTREGEQVGYSKEEKDYAEKGVGGGGGFEGPDVGEAHSFA